MTRRVTLLFTTLAAALALALPATPQPAAAAAGDPVLSYNVDLVSNYVFRGVEVFAAANPDRSAFKAVPALQPSLTFNGPAGFSFGLWGSYALTERSPSDSNLESLDELDYTLSWGWGNRMGDFSAGLATYTYTSVASHGANSEMFFTWGLPFAKSISPTISHYVAIDAGSSAAPATIVGGSTYTSLGISGGESVSWHASVGMSTGIQDVTAGVGYGFGDFSASLNLAYRPTKELVAETDGYASTIAWITLSYGRAVTE